MCLRCVLEDHSIENCLKLDTLDKKVHWNKENTKSRAYRSAKIDKSSEKVETKESHRRYTRLWHLYLPMQKFLEGIL